MLIMSYMYIYVDNNNNKSLFIFSLFVQNLNKLLFHHYLNPLIRKLFLISFKETFVLNYPINENMFGIKNNLFFIYHNMQIFSYNHHHFTSHYHLKSLITLNLKNLHLFFLNF